MNSNKENNQEFIKYGSILILFRYEYSQIAVSSREENTMIGFCMTILNGTLLVFEAERERWLDSMTE